MNYLLNNTYNIYTQCIGCSNLHHNAGAATPLNIIIAAQNELGLQDGSIEGSKNGRTEV